MKSKGTPKDQGPEQSQPARGQSPPGSVPRRPAARVTPRRADFGAPIDAFFARQPPDLRAILEELRLMVEEAAPDAVSSLKWGMPWFAVEGNMMCSLGAHKAHVNLVLVGPSEAFEDPEGRLSGTGESGRHLKLTTTGELPRDAIRRWLEVAAKLAREGA